MKKSTKNSSQSGFVSVFVILLIFVLLILGVDLAYVYFNENCPDLSLSECFNHIKDQNSEEESPENPDEERVTANGVFSKGKYSVNITMSVPLSGGEVSGSFSGSCNGKIYGNFSGGENGSLNGKASGSCTTPLLLKVPASAVFTGTVNQQSKQIPISGTGSAVGFSGEGSLVLSY